MSNNASIPAVAQIGFALHGSGPEHVLALHDWNGDRSNYDSVRPYLDGSAFTYAFADLRGYGASRNIEGEYSVEEISRDCLALADRLGWTRFHVIGHSMTGMATQRLAADAPSRIKSAIAVCPVSAAGSSAPEDARLFFAATTHDDDAFKRLIAYISGGLSPQWAAFKLEANRTRVNPRCRDGYLAMFWEANFVDDVKGLETPFLVIVGDHDPGLDEKAMRSTFIAWHPNSDVVVVPNCGHYPMHECPPYFATAVEKFLRAHAA